VADLVLEDEWWEGELNGKVGMFPANYVEKQKRYGQAFSGRI